MTSHMLTVTRITTGVVPHGSLLKAMVMFRVYYSVEGCCIAKLGSQMIKKVLLESSECDDVLLGLDLSCFS